MNTTLNNAILVAIAQEGSFEDVEMLGFTPSQVVFGVKRLIEAGQLVRVNGRFRLADNVQIPNNYAKKWKNIDILTEHSIEKVELKDEYEIGHQSFVQIYERVRT